MLNNNRLSKQILFLILVLPLWILEVIMHALAAVSLEQLFALPTIKLKLLNLKLHSE